MFKYYFFDGDDDFSDVELVKVRNKCGFSSNGLLKGLGLWWRDVNV